MILISGFSRTSSPKSVENASYHCSPPAPKQQSAAICIMKEVEPLAQPKLGIEGLQQRGDEDEAWQAATIRKWQANRHTD